MKSKSVGVVKMAMLFCVPLLPVAALPLVQHLQARAAKHGLWINAQATKSLQYALKTGPHPGGSAKVRDLVSQGADVDARLDQFGNPALSIAVMHGSVEMARTLLDLGADVNARNDAGETALTMAIRRPDVDAVRMLLDGGANVSIPANANQPGVTPLGLARGVLASGSLEPQTPYFVSLRRIVSLLEGAGAR